MQRGTPAALAIIRVPRGQGPPSDDTIRAALARDRAHLHLPQNGTASAYELAGPYALIIEDQEVDEYVAWET